MQRAFGEVQKAHEQPGRGENHRGGHVIEEPAENESSLRRVRPLGPPEPASDTEGKQRRATMRAKKDFSELAACRRTSFRSSFPLRE